MNKREFSQDDQLRAGRCRFRRDFGHSEKFNGLVELIQGLEDGESLPTESLNELYRLLNSLLFCRNWNRDRVDEFDKIFRKFPEPWRTLSADIIANGRPRWWECGEILKKEIKAMNITTEEMAQLLNGREYGNEITEDEGQLANENGLVIVLECDGKVSFKGGFSGEINCFDRVGPHEGEIIAEVALIVSANANAKEIQKSITANWNNRQCYTCSLETDIPHVAFETLESEGKICRGIVFSLEDIKAKE
jgi:hypothetical protein